MTTLLNLNELNARRAANPNLVLVEALPEKYYREGHLPGARHLPHDEVSTQAPAVLPERDAEIVVYCASVTCQNSHIAARALERLGYSRVGVFTGGKKDWIEAGLPVEVSPAKAAA